MADFGEHQQRTVTLLANLDRATQDADSLKDELSVKADKLTETTGQLADERLKITRLESAVSSNEQTISSLQSEKVTCLLCDMPSQMQNDCTNGINDCHMHQGFTATQVT